MPAMPDGAREGILKGMYRLRASSNGKSKLKSKLGAKILGSGAIPLEAVKAQKLLEEKSDVAADVWSVTSYKELYRDGHAADRWNLLHPAEEPRVPYVTACLRDAAGPIVAASDYVKALPDSVSRWCPRPVVSLGTDGFGRSEGRSALRNFFEVDSRFITLAVLSELAREKKIKAAVVEQAMKDLEIDPAKADPAVS